MAVDDQRVVSIAHTPRPMTEHEAECGVWTDPTARGKGLATATASAWANILRSTGRKLIYSTTEDNLSSQRVAERLKLELLSCSGTIIAWRPMRKAVPKDVNEFVANWQ